MESLCSRQRQNFEPSNLSEPAYPSHTRSSLYTPCYPSSESETSACQGRFYAGRLNEKKVRDCFETWNDYFHQAKDHRFFDDVMHLASLLHATACMVLRHDSDFGNLITYSRDELESNPPGSSYGLRKLLRQADKCWWCPVSSNGFSFFG